MVKYNYKSQVEYGIHGSHICTPASIVVAYEFLMLCDASNERIIFGSGVMDEIMRNCHDFYNKHFSAHIDKNLMISEFFSYFPETVFYHEIAGTVTLASSKHISMCQEETLWITPLQCLFNKILAAPIHLCIAIVVTRLDHTVAYLFDTRRDQFCYFDPIHASILDISFQDCSEIIDQYLIGDEYSGIVMVSKSMTPNHGTDLQSFLHCTLF